MSSEMEMLLVRAIVQMLWNQSKSEHHDTITSGGKTRIFPTVTEQLAEEIQEQMEKEQDLPLPEGPQ